MTGLDKGPTPPSLHKTMNLAASQGHLEMVEWLRNNRSEGCTTDAMDKAALGGYFDVLKFLHLNRSEGFTARAMDDAFRFGRSEKESHWNGNFWNYELIEGGNLEVVKWLHENRTEGCDMALLEQAILDSSIDVVSYLIENDLEFGRLDEAIDWVECRCDDSEREEIKEKLLAKRRERDAVTNL